MSNSNRIVLWILGLLLLGGVIWYVNWFFTNFEEYTHQVRVDVSPEARKNRYLAAQMLLAKNGVKVESKTGRDIFALHPSTRDTIFLGSHSSLFLERNNRKLIEWVRNGGNLILVPERTPFEEDKDKEKDKEKKQSLLKELGVSLRFVYEDKVPGKCNIDKNSSKNTNKDEKSSPQKPNPLFEDEAQTKKRLYHTVTFHSDDPGEFKAQFLRDRYLKGKSEKADVVVGDDGKPNLLMYPLGSGSVTVLSDAHLFSNNAIGELDHAYLFDLLAERPGKVWIFYSAEMPSLLMLVWKHTPYVLLTLILLLIFAGWAMLRKSGPRLKPQFDSRRNLLEHLSATAQYSWRTDKARQLFDDNRNAVEQAWRRRHPQLNTLDTAQRCEWIGEKTGLASRAVERTLYGDISSEQDFIRASAVMQKLATLISTHHVHTEPAKAES